jgi:hypothetical protein
VKVEYCGPHKSVEVPLGDGSAVVVRRGDAVELPDDVVAGLVVQSTWREAKGKADKAEDAPAAKAPEKAGKDGK